MRAVGFGLAKGSQVKHYQPPHDNSSQHEKRPPPLSTSLHSK